MVPSEEGLVGAKAPDLYLRRMLLIVYFEYHHMEQGLMMAFARSA